MAGRRVRARAARGRRTTDGPPPPGGTDGRPRARGDGGRRTDRQLRGGGAASVSSGARVREGGAVPRGPHVSPVLARGHAAHSSSPSSGGPRPARPPRRARTAATARGGAERSGRRRRCTRAASSRRSDASFRATVRRHDRPQSKTGKGAAAGSGAAGRLVATGASRRPLCLRRGVGPVCRAGLFTPCGTLLVAYS